jgi:hypothetical protein
MAGKLCVMAHITVPDESTVTNFVVTTAQSVFSFPWTCFDKTDIQVLVGASLLLQSDFTFVGNPGTEGGFDGGTVTLVAAVSNVTVTIYRDIIVQRTDDFGAGPVSSRDRNTALDRLTAMVQDAKRIAKGVPPEAPLLPDAVQTVGNIVALRAALWPSGRPTQIYLVNNWTTGDGGGTFRWDATSTATDNGGTIIKEAAVTTGRWARQFSGQGVVSSWFSATVHLGVQAALDAGFDYILLPNFTAPISWTGQVTLPQARRVTVESGGQTIFVNPNIVGFSFRRSIAAVSGNLFTFKGNGGLVVENGLARTSIFIDFRGAAVTAGMTITRSGGIATVSLPSPHLLSTGATVETQGANQSQYNGRFTCTVTGANTLTFPVTGTPTTPATGNLCFSSQETANYNDNRVVVERAEFRGFFRDFYTERCGGEFSKISSRFNGVMWESGRDTSFIALSDILSVNDVSTIYYLDVYPNGLSNGVSLDRVYSVLAGGAGSVGGIYMVGIEGMTGQSNSVDLCFGATYGLTLILCTSLDLEFTWIASDLTQAASHRGWYLEDAIRSTFRVATNVSSFVFGWVESSRFPTQPLYLSLNMPLFYGPANAGIIFNNAIGVSVEPGYKFTNVMPRSAADYEFAGIGTCNRNTIGQGHMRGASYTIAPGLGAASIVSTPLFIP